MQGPEAPPLFTLQPLSLGPTCPPERRKDRRMETWEGCSNQHPGCARYLLLLSASQPPRSPVAIAASSPAPMTLVSRMGRVPDRNCSQQQCLPSDRPRTLTSSSSPAGLSEPLDGTLSSPPLSGHHTLLHPCFGDAPSLSSVLPCACALWGTNRKVGKTHPPPLAAGTPVV